MRSFLLLTMTLLAAGPLTAGYASAAGITLNRTIVVHDGVVRLGDIFAGLGERGDTTIARAPEPGRQVKLDGRWLAALAKTHSVDWRPRSALDTARVERASARLDSREIERLVADALSETGDAGAFSIRLDDPSVSLHFPAGSLERPTIEAVQRDPRTGRFAAALIYPADTLRKTITVTGRALEMIEVPVLRRRIGASEVIGEDDIEWIRLRADRTGQDIFLDPAGMIGKSPRRNLRAGQPVREKDLRAPVIVQKNSLVTIRLQTPYIRLTTQGRALDEGSLGEAIRVLNTKSKTVVNAVVSKSGIVDVSVPPTSDSN